jgi:hypothetical protein
LFLVHENKKNQEWKKLSLARKKPLGYNNGQWMGKIGY